MAGGTNFVSTSAPAISSQSSIPAIWPKELAEGPTGREAKKSESNSEIQFGLDKGCLEKDMKEDEDLVVLASLSNH